MTKSALKINKASKSKETEVVADHRDWIIQAIRSYLEDKDGITYSSGIQAIVTKTVDNTVPFIAIQTSEYKRKRMCENILFNKITDIEQQSMDATLPYFNANYAGERQYYLSKINSMLVSDANYHTEKAIVADNRTEVKEVVDESTGEVRLESEQPIDLGKLSGLQNLANKYKMVHNNAKAQYVTSRALQMADIL